LAPFSVCEWCRERHRPYSGPYVAKQEWQRQYSTRWQRQCRQHCIDFHAHNLAE